MSPSCRARSGRCRHDRVSSPERRRPGPLVLARLRFLCGVSQCSPPSSAAAKRLYERFASSLNNRSLSATCFDCLASTSSGGPSLATVLSPTRRPPRRSTIGNSGSAVAPCSHHRVVTGRTIQPMPGYCCRIGTPAGRGLATPRRSVVLGTSDRGPPVPRRFSVRCVASSSSGYQL
jgi:hypothetical protein